MLFRSIRRNSTVRVANADWWLSGPEVLEQLDPPVDDPKEPGDEPNTSETETPDRPKTDAVVLSTLLFGMALLSGSIVIVLKKKKALR